MADVVVLLNPLDVSRRRRWNVPAGEPLLAWLEAHEPASSGVERRVYVNDHPCTDPAYRCQARDQVLVAFTPGDPATFSLTTFLLTSVVTGVISFLVGKLFAPHQPSATDTPQPSQVYGIAPPRNASRLGQPIPAIYGSVICLPDFAAQPYTFFNGNEQYLDALLCVGLGEYVIDPTALLLGQTSGAALAEGIVKWSVYGPALHGSAFGVIEGATGVRENVVSSPAVGDQELIAPNAGGVLTASTWYWALSNFQRTFSDPGGLDLTTATSPAAKLAKLATVAGPIPALGTPVFCKLGYDGSTYTSGTYTATAYTAGQQTAPGALIPPPSYSQAGQAKWLGFFTTCKPGQRGALIELDFVFPGGLYTGDASGNLNTCTVTVSVEAQPIDDNGNNAGALVAWTETFSAKDNTPQRFTRPRVVASGRYNVRAQRTTNADLKVATADHVIWGGLKFQLNPPAVGTKVYGNVTLIALRLKATNGVASDAASSLRFRVTRKLSPLGDPAQPTVATRNPADAFADVIVAAYGGARPWNAEELDIDELTRSRNLWDGADGFNAVFDQASTVWEALGLTVQTVHAAPLPVGSRMSLVHDGVQPVRSQLFTDANVAAGTLQVTHQFDTTGTPLGVRVNYRDPLSFSPVALLNPPDAPDYTTLDLFGCTSASVAAEHAALVDAKRRNQRSTIAFTTELEGLNVLPGDRVGVQASLVRWGQVARVESWKIAADNWLELVLDRALVWTAGAQHAVQLRDPVGEPVRYGMDGVQPGSAPNVVRIFPSDIPFTITGANASQEATAVAFGVWDYETTDWTVTKVTPNGDTVTIEAVNYAPAIYASAAAFTRAPFPDADAGPAAEADAGTEADAPPLEEVSA
jgi:hypothetical protein